ncbi:hypothetical protein BG011_009869 [Mortierella polycephala]|uniref:FAD-binding domain-containing protein n=1 Tax=Mortierella polycephala TaxID=41804 RepID=A0A9P6PKJ0_9FUNG|nr:hypothetical protein BG011_009869 [Mortierella polycephala]
MASDDGPRAYTYSTDTNSFIQTEILSHVSDRPPHVLIIGAGIGGLLLGNLLEIAKIPYQIFERSKEIKPVGMCFVVPFIVYDYTRKEEEEEEEEEEGGSVMCLTENIFPALEQLGLYDELQKFSHLAYLYNFYSDDMKKIGNISGKGYKKSIGYSRFLLRRSDLLRTLLNRTPPEKIHLGKRLLSYVQNNEGVKARFNNNTTYLGDILIGADGGHSAVRQLMYKELEARDKLPEADKQKSTKGFSNIVGATSTLDTDRFPGIVGPKSEASLMVGSSPTSPNWSTISVAGNQICWNVISQLDVASFEAKQFRTTEWSVESNQHALDEIKHLKTPYGTMGDLIDATPNDRITSILLEDRLYETWTHGRVALIGDACHKLLPSTGQGAVNALLDAVILANNLYDLGSLSYNSIKGMLRDYREQRYQNVKELYTSSQLNAMVQFGHVRKIANIDLEDHDEISLSMCIHA